MWSSWWSTKVRTSAEAIFFLWRALDKTQFKLICVSYFVSLHFLVMPIVNSKDFVHNRSSMAYHWVCTNTHMHVTYLLPYKLYQSLQKKPLTDRCFVTKPSILCHLKLERAMYWKVLAGFCSYFSTAFSTKLLVISQKNEPCKPN